jgi:hypothetical protein
LREASESPKSRSQRSSEDDNSPARVVDSLSSADSPLNLERASSSEALRSLESSLEASAELSSRLKSSSSLSQLELGPPELGAEAPGAGAVEGEGEGGPEDCSAQDGADESRDERTRHASHLMAPPRML